MAGFECYAGRCHSTDRHQGSRTDGIQPGILPCSSPRASVSAACSRCYSTCRCSGHPHPSGQRRSRHQRAAFLVGWGKGDRSDPQSRDAFANLFSKLRGAETRGGHHHRSGNHDASDPACCNCLLVRLADRRRMVWIWAWIRSRRSHPSEKTGGRKPLSRRPAPRPCNQSDRGAQCHDQAGC